MCDFLIGLSVDLTVFFLVCRKTHGRGGGLSALLLSFYVFTDDRRTAAEVAI